MSIDEQAREDRLIQMVASSPVLMDLLGTVKTLGLTSWCIGAGAIRSLVWDRLHGYAATSQYDDVDVVYYDDTAGAADEGELLKQLLALNPSTRWEVTNQALVHQWFLSEHAQVVPPLRSLSEGIATWPEYATCVGVTLGAENAVEVIAPHGLQDLFQLRVRHNPMRANAAVFMERVTSKRLVERWPMLAVEA